MDGKGPDRVDRPKTRAGKKHKEARVMLTVQKLTACLECTVTYVVLFEGAC